MKSIFEAVDFANKDSIAIEALVIAETQFMTGDYPKEEVDDTQMCYKDDEGYWRITGMIDKWDSYADLQNRFPDL